MNNLKKIFGNKWVKFSIVTIIYALWFLVWARNWWMLLGVVVIYDIYISKYMYRWFWKRHKERKKSNGTYKKTFEWVEAILFAVVVASLIRVFFFEMYVIPSSSMEKSLLVNDYLCVSKVAYGPRMPVTPVSFPLVHHTMPLSKTKKSFSEIIKRPYKRLNGWGDVKLGDIVVFNFPAGDTVILERQNESYYEILSDYQKRYGQERGRVRVFSEYTIITRPIDKRENYVKRAVGTPGDTLLIVHSQLYINGQPFINIPGVQFNYFVYIKETPIPDAVFKQFGISKDEVYANLTEGWYIMPLTSETIEKVKALPNVTMVIKSEERDNSDPRIFPNAPSSYSWNIDNFGPLWIPKEGATVELNELTLPLYSRIISLYENNELEVKDGAVYINGVLSDSYTFKMNYYFMMGDNRHWSLDSRFWGFVPQDHVVGKPSFIWLSIDKDKGWFGGRIRWHRMFRSLELE